MMSSSGSGSVPTVAVGEQLNGLYKLIEDLSATVNVLNNKNISLSVQLQALSIASASSSNSSGGDSSAIAKSIQAVEERVTELESKCSVLTNQNMELTLRLDELTQQNIDLVALNQDLQQRNEDLMIEVHHFSLRLDDADANQQVLHQRTMAIVGELQSLASETDVLSDKLNRTFTEALIPNKDLHQENNPVPFPANGLCSFDVVSKNSSDTVSWNPITGRLLFRYDTNARYAVSSIPLQQDMISTWSMKILRTVGNMTALNEDLYVMIGVYVCSGDVLTRMDCCRRTSWTEVICSGGMGTFGRMERNLGTTTVGGVGYLKTAVMIM
jgi:hypothetical protein